MDEVRQYAPDRDDAVVACIDGDTLEPFKAFVAKYAAKGFFPDCFELPSDEVLEISIRQMCLHCTNIPHDIKGKAVDWLTSHNHKLDCFGED